MPPSLLPKRLLIVIAGTSPVLIKCQTQFKALRIGLLAHCARHSSVGQVLLLSAFTDRNTAAQNGLVTRPNAQGLETAELGFRPWHSSSGVCALGHNVGHRVMDPFYGWKGQG